MRAERRDPTLRPKTQANLQGEELVPEAKPYDIPKQVVWEASQRVKANRGVMSQISEICRTGAENGDRLTSPANRTAAPDATCLLPAADLLRIMCMSSIPTRVTAADQNDWKPSIGRTRRLMA